jgi:hypothetical protein
MLSIVNQSVSDTLTPRNMKYGFVVTGVQPFTRYVYGEDFSPSAVADRSFKGSKNLKHFWLSDSDTSISNLDVRGQPPASG